LAVIVNADDFGIDTGVNEAIKEAFEKKLIDRTTLMVNMPYAKDAMEIARREGFDGRVGIHLNLTSGRPLTEDMASDRIMCDDGGEFTADFARSLKRRFFLPSKTSENIERELRAQLDGYRKLGGTLWHVDSHHHVHTDPSVWRVLKRVLRDYPVTSVRLGRNMYRGGNPLMRLYKVMLNASIKRFCSDDVRYFGSMTDYEEYEPYIGPSSRNTNVEIMVHPVYDDKNRVCDKRGDKLVLLKEIKTEQEIKDEH
jgi:hypothetical protein